MNHATTPETPNSSSVSEFPRCQHRMRKGRCRELASDPAASLCFKHAAQHKKDRDAANVAAQLIRDTDDFTSAVTINRSLTELYKLLARDEISPRRGAVMAYTCNLLLRTLPAIKHELYAQDEQQPAIIMDIPALSPPEPWKPDARAKRNAGTPNPPSPRGLPSTAPLATSPHPLSPTVTTATPPFRTNPNDNPPRAKRPG